MKSDSKGTDSARRPAGDGATTKTAEQLKQSSRDARAQLGRAASTAKDEARDKLEQGKRAAVETVEDTTQALDDAAWNLSAQGHESLAKAASTMSAQLARLADHVGTKSLDELARDARELAHRNPGLVVAGGLAIGFALTRFVKAAPDRDSGTEDEMQFTGSAARPPEGGGSGERPRPQGPSV